MGRAIIAVLDSFGVGATADADRFGDVGSDIASAENALEVEEFLVSSLAAQRDQVSGVNLDEELVNMIEFEQAYGAAAQFIQVVNTLNDELLAIL